MSCVCGDRGGGCHYRRREGGAHEVRGRDECGSWLPLEDEPTLLKTLQCMVLVDEMSKRLCPAFAVTKHAVILTACETAPA
jgi:hypothetical protein